MALEGHVHTISLFEVIRFLAAGHHTGVLQIWQDRRRREVSLAEGLILSITGQDRHAPDSRQLGVMLHQMGRIDMQSLLDALAEQERSGGLLGEILVASGVVPQAEIDRTLRMQLEERLFDTFLWSRASYRFRRQDQPMGEHMARQQRISLPAESFLLEAARRLDEWNRILTLLPAPSTILRIAAGREDDCIEHIVAAGVSFDTDLISGRRPIEALFEVSGALQVVTGSLIADLIAAGAVEPLPVADAISSFEQAMSAGQLQQGLHNLCHLRDHGLPAAELRALEDAFFSDTRPTRAALTGTYRVAREGVPLVNLCRILLESCFPAMLSVRADAPTTEIGISATRIVGLGLLNRPEVYLTLGDSGDLPLSSFAGAGKQPRLVADVQDWLSRSSVIASLDTVIASSWADGAQVQPSLPLELIDGHHTIRRLLEESSSLPRTSFEMILDSLEAGAIRPASADEVIVAIEHLLAEGRPTDALRACRGALELGLPEATFGPLIAEIVAVHGDHARPLPEYRFQVAIGDISLAEVFQSLHTHKKSGTLEVHGERVRRSLHFEHGDLVHLGPASDFPEVEWQPGVAGMLVTEAEAPTELVQAVRELVLDMFLWDNTSVEFVANVFPEAFLNPTRTTVKLKLDSERLFMEIVGLIQRAEELRRTVVWDRGVAFSSAEGREKARIELGDDELLQLVEDRALVAEIVARSPYARIDTLELLADYCERGLLRQMSDDELEAHDAAKSIGG